MATSLEVCVPLYFLRNARSSVHEPVKARPLFVYNRVNGFVSALHELRALEDWMLVPPKMIEKSLFRGAEMHPVFTEQEEQLLAIAPCYPSGSWIADFDDACRDERLEIADTYFRLYKTTPVDLVSDILKKCSISDPLSKKRFTEGAIDCLYAVGLISWNTGKALLSGLQNE